MTSNLYIKISLYVLAFFGGAFLFGFLLPFLFSAKSDFLVVLGVAIVIQLCIYVIFFVVLKLNQKLVGGRNE